MIRRLIGTLALLWVLGFALFMLLLPKPIEGQKTDAIVVLTGGAGRVDRGLDLLRRHAAQRLLISGVAPQVKARELAATYPRSKALFGCCVDLGRQAVDTRSNADETAAWLRAHHYRSVRLVTSDWHMARARMELENAVGGDTVVIADAVTSSPKLWLLVTEYNKLIIRRAALWLGLGA